VKVTLGSFVRPHQAFELLALYDAHGKLRNAPK
jgi:hypothetical protein